MGSASPMLPPQHAVGAEVRIRPYAPEDRAAVRQLCCDTANRGEPMDGSPEDRELFADLMTNYYTQEEPQASWVAECHGRVIGYLTGCLESRRYARRMAWHVVPRALLRAIGRGALGSAYAWRWLAAGIRTGMAGGFDRRIPARAYPAHLHVNIEPRFRGVHVGRQLIERFCAQAQAAGLPGAHAAIREDNAPARALFERLGFTVISRHPVVRPEPSGAIQGHTLIYGKQW